LRKNRIEAADVTVNDGVFENSVTTKRILGYSKIPAEDAEIARPTYLAMED
jgi:hypothetical protein